MTFINLYYNAGVSNWHPDGPMQPIRSFCCHEIQDTIKIFNLTCVLNKFILFKHAKAFLKTH